MAGAPVCCHPSSDRMAQGLPSSQLSSSCLGQEEVLCWWSVELVCHHQVQRRLQQDPAELTAAELLDPCRVLVQVEVWQQSWPSP